MEVCIREIFYLEEQLIEFLKENGADILSLLYAVKQAFLHYQLSIITNHMLIFFKRGFVLKNFRFLPKIVYAIENSAILLTLDLPEFAKQSARLFTLQSSKLKKRPRPQKVLVNFLRSCVTQQVPTNNQLRGIVVHTNHRM